METQITPNNCTIEWKDTKERRAVTIVTYGKFEEGSKEDEITFFYCKDIAELRSLMEEDNGEDFVVVKLNGYGKKEFDVQCKPFMVKGAPEYYSIARGDYECMPDPMKAWDWSDEKMQQLADRIATFFDYKTFVEQKWSEDEIDDEFWRTMEQCAVGMGMTYYEDMTDEEFNNDTKAYEEYIKG